MNQRSPDELARRENRILDHLHTVVATKGTHVLTMEGVAAAMGFSKGTLYSHFRSLPDALLALALRTLAVRTAAAREVPLWPVSPRERFMAILLNDEITMMEHNLRHVRSYVTRDIIDRASPERREQWAVTVTRAMAGQRALITEAMAHGELSRDTAPDHLQAAVHALFVGMGDLLNGRFAFNPAPLDENAQLFVRWVAVGRLLDGYGWKPFWNDRAGGKLAHRVSPTRFPL